MTQDEWLTSEYQYEMLQHLNNKVADEAFIPFSIACCRRIWPLITDSLARAVVDMTEAAALGSKSWDDLSPVHAAWHHAYLNDEVEDLAGGITNEAIDSVCGLGDGHAAQVSSICCESAGYAAAKHLEELGASQAEQTNAWKAAAKAECLAHCHLIRSMFAYLPE